VPLAEALLAHPETFSRRQADYPALDPLVVTSAVETSPLGAFEGVDP
jgi:hypothetical protein